MEKEKAKVLTFKINNRLTTCHIVGCRYSVRMQQDACGMPCYNDNFSMEKGATNVSYGMSMAQGAFVAEPGTANSMMSNTNFHSGPELPPRKDFYMIPQSTLAPPNAYDYIKIDPVRAVYLSEPPPPHYEACSSLKVAADDELYDEIPGEYLQTSTFSGKEEKGCGDVQCDTGTNPSSSGEVTLKL